MQEALNKTEMRCQKVVNITEMRCQKVVNITEKMQCAAAHDVVSPDEGVAVFGAQLPVNVSEEKKKRKKTVSKTGREGIGF